MQKQTGRQQEQMQASYRDGVRFVVRGLDGRSRPFQIAACVLCAISAVLIWHSVPTLRGMALYAGFVSMCVLVNLLPDGGAKRLLFLVLAVPVKIVMSIAYTFEIILAIPITVFMLILVQFMFWAVVSSLLPTHVPNMRAVAYVVFVTTLVLLAYWGPRLLLAWARLLGRGRRKEEPDPMPAIERLVEKMEFRRRSYEIGLAIFILATFERVSGMVLIHDDTWASLKSISLEAFLTFVVVDQYIAQYIPSLVSDSPKRTRSSTRSSQGVRTGARSGGKSHGR